MSVGGKKKGESANCVWILLEEGGKGGGSVPNLLLRFSACFRNGRGSEKEREKEGERGKIAPLFQQRDPISAHCDLGKGRKKDFLKGHCS